MEADWAVEIGAGAEVIDALWTGFIDLATSPERISEIAEAAHFPSLGRALLQINRPVSSAEPPSAFWTAKCDLWEPETWDPLEMEAAPEHSRAALSCYIDLLPRSPATGHALFQHWQDAERCARCLAMEIRKKPCPAARLDCVVRSAMLPEQAGFGITLYLVACGADAAGAASALEAALETLIEALAPCAPARNLLPLQ